MRLRILSLKILHLAQWLDIAKGKLCFLWLCLFFKKKDLCGQNALIYHCEGITFFKLTCTHTNWNGNYYFNINHYLFFFCYNTRYSFSMSAGPKSDLSLTNQSYFFFQLSFILVCLLPFTTLPKIYLVFVFCLIYSPNIQFVRG